MLNTSIRHQRAIAVFSIMAFVLLTQVSAAAQKSPRRIRFEPGHSSTTVSGRIVGYEAKDYVVGAKAGQELTVRVKDATASAYFVISSINGKLTNMTETDEWSEVLTESGDCLIRVFMMRSAARRKGAVANYKLNISIH